MWGVFRTNQINENRSYKSGSYKLHHFLVSLFCVFALVCIVTSLYSITSTIGSDSKRQNVERSLRSIKEISHTHGKSSSKAHKKSSRTFHHSSGKLHKPLDFHSESAQVRAAINQASHIQPLLFGKAGHIQSSPFGVSKSNILDSEGSDYHYVRKHPYHKKDVLNITESEPETDSKPSPALRKIIKAVEENKPINNPDDVSTINDHGTDSKLSPALNKIIKAAEKGKEKKTVDYPTLPQNYHASGLLILPHSNIAEPFEVWYAPSVHKSRIDYYYGTDKTFQRADKGSNGIAYKYVPMYNDVQKGFDGCWTLTGNEGRPIIPQTVTPNITWFQYNKTEVYTGTMTTKWTYQYFAFGMRNHQSVWITTTKPHRPIRYEMYGFDMMLGSYYDHYVLEYVTFEEWDGNHGVFNLPEGILCYNWTNSLASSLQINPMQEFAVFSEDRAFDHSESYEEYKAQQQKDYASDEEELKRKHIYKHNKRYVNSHNRKNATFKLNENQFLDMKSEELNVLHGSLEKDTKKHKGIKDITIVDDDNNDIPLPVEVPDELDWRDYGAVTPVKGQGICGACYAFTATAAAEAAWYRKTGKLVEVSTQQLLDCSWGYGNHGCKGGHYAAALSWIFVHGVSTHTSYGKYLGQEGYCHFNDTWFGAKIDGFAYIQPWNKTALKRAVAKYGPVAVSVNTSPLSFKFYSHGIYSDRTCSRNHTGHSALVIGYGKENGIDYWLLKNSWSSSWGENGYMKITMDDDLCGITEYPVAVVVNKPQFHLSTTTKIKSSNEKGRKIKHKQTKSKNRDKPLNMKEVQEADLPTNEAISRSSDPDGLKDDNSSYSETSKVDNEKPVKPKESSESLDSIETEKIDNKQEEQEKSKSEKNKGPSNNFNNSDYINNAKAWLKALNTSAQKLSEASSALRVSSSVSNEKNLAADPTNAKDPDAELQLKNEVENSKPSSNIPFIGLHILNAEESIDEKEPPTSQETNKDFAAKKMHEKQKEEKEKDENQIEVDSAAKKLHEKQKEKEEEDENQIEVDSAAKKLHEKQKEKEDQSKKISNKTKEIKSKKHKELKNKGKIEKDYEVNKKLDTEKEKEDVKQSTSAFPLFEIAKDLYRHATIKEQKHLKEKEKEKAKNLDKLLKTFGQEILTDSKPTINPENIDIYESENQRKLNPKHPTVKGTKKQTIEKHKYLDPHHEFLKRLMKPLKLIVPNKEQHDTKLERDSKQFSNFDQEQDEEETEEKKDKKEEEKEEEIGSLEALDKLENRITSKFQDPSSSEQVKNKSHHKKAVKHKKMSNYEKEAKHSMESLYSRIDKAAKQSSNPTKNTINRHSSPTNFQQENLLNLDQESSPPFPTHQQSSQINVPSTNSLNNPPSVYPMNTALTVDPVNVTPSSDSVNIDSSVDINNNEQMTSLVPTTSLQNNAQAEILQQQDIIKPAETIPSIESTVVATAENTDTNNPQDHSAFQSLNYSPNNNLEVKPSSPVTFSSTYL